MDKTSQADYASFQSQLTIEERKNFQDWVALGVGGLPHTLEGFRTLQILNARLRDPLDVSHLARMIDQPGDLAALGNLPRRNGSRPLIAPFAVPHRQTDQHNSTAIRDRQKSAFDQAVEQKSAMIHYRKSFFEAHNEAVFIKNMDAGNQTIVRTAHGEIGHIHPGDGSMHFSLSPSDTKEVLSKGWGELHGLAGQIYKPDAALPATYTLVYSPRTEEELAVVEKILEAAIRYSLLPAETRDAAALARKD